MHNPNLPKVVAIPPRMQKRFGTGTMLVPSPGEIEAFIRTVRKSRISSFWNGSAWNRN